MLSSHAHALRERFSDFCVFPLLGPEFPAGPVDRERRAAARRPRRTSALPGHDGAIGPYSTQCAAPGRREPSDRRLWAACWACHYARGRADDPELLCATGKAGLGSSEKRQSSTRTVNDTREEREDMADEQPVPEPLAVAAAATTTPPSSSSSPPLQQQQQRGEVTTPEGAAAAAAATVDIEAGWNAAAGSAAERAAAEAEFGVQTVSEPAAALTLWAENAWTAFELGVMKLSEFKVIDRNVTNTAMQGLVKASTASFVFESDRYTERVAGIQVVYIVGGYVSRTQRLVRVSDSAEFALVEAVEEGPGCVRQQSPRCPAFVWPRLTRH
jgi:hypothetical protein